ncbi:MAG: UDP-N-acetylmuramoyl-L-alanyl-D-glutamate--2,6-diaminopimelate ligase [Abitibacteriaceae bacterium]|nr:UDP-N-acetylmuramoyl-L-alanyl-D-glutamate--2,6-diaminopimelate ligase [Abditibacteriaceae bacterium]
MPALKELLIALPEFQVFGNEQAEVAAIAYDSREVGLDTAFVCIRGQQRDGHEFIPQALERGATTIVADNEAAVKALPAGITGVLVPDTRLALAGLACEFYSNPSREMLLVGITGTNGKTTVAHLIAELLREAGYKSVGIIGTLGAATERAFYDTGRTTPESLDLQRLLADFLDGGSEAVVMEVSSHALSLQRVAGCAFDAGVFTNLTQDHLDFHKDMEDYFQAKAKLFNEVAHYSEHFKSFGAVLNVDDHYGRRLRDEVSKDSLYITYGIENEAHVTAEAIHLTPIGTSFVARSSTGNIHLDSNLTGRFNVYNSLAAVGFGLLQGMPLPQIQAALQRAAAPEGRMEMIEGGQDFYVAVDYAHTPDGLKNVMATVREFTPGRLITVFGCGGDRDRTKRPQMGAIAASFSDLLVITSDNPRTEDPTRIIDDILAGTVQGHAECVVEVDRRQAIEKALSLARHGDFVLVAGKGHETYQIFKDRTIHFDDREVVREFLEDPVKKDAA